jgi:hypothetical protein
MFVLPKDRKHDLVGGKFSRTNGFECPPNPHQIFMIVWIIYIMILYCTNVIKYGFVLQVNY